MPDDFRVFVQPKKPFNKMTDDEVKEFADEYAEAFIEAQKAEEEARRGQAE